MFPSVAHHVDVLCVLWGLAVLWILQLSWLMEIREGRSDDEGLIGKHHGDKVSTEGKHDSTSF